MEPTLEDELRKRILMRLHADDATNFTGPPPIDGIMLDAETYGVLKVRAALVRLHVKQGTGAYGANDQMDYVRRIVREDCPLPNRTRRVLREEPVPEEGEDGPLFRVRDGVLEWTPNPCGCVGGEKWHTYAAWMGMRGVRQTANDWHRVRHALDLYDYPYRTEEMPADESNPWGDE